MRILLVGEYSRLHNSLKEGLESLGHEVNIIASGDYFKNYPADIKLQRRFDKGIAKKLKVAIFKVFNFDITSFHLKRQFLKQKKNLINYHIVQLINESPNTIAPRDEQQIIQFLLDSNNKVFLLSCGTDYINVNFAHQNKLKYSILTPLLDGKISKKDYVSVLKYLEAPYKALHDFVFKNIKGVIASDMDYHLPLQGHEKYLGLIPNPINTDKLEYIELNITDKIIIFHGINDMSYFKKGNDIFEEALKIILTKHSEKIEIITVRSLPYAEYIHSFNKAHIVLDQVYGYDQGYNALEAMAKGKVVFTGAEQEWLDYYSLEEDTVAINALPDAKKIAEKLEWLILNPEKIVEISRNARAFIEREHHYVRIAERYLGVWITYN